MISPVALLNLRDPVSLVEIDGVVRSSTLWSQRTVVDARSSRRGKEQETENLGGRDGDRIQAERSDGRR